MQRVEGERLGGGAGEGLGEPVDRAGGLDPVRRRVRFELVRDRVEAALLAGAAEGDVAPFLQRALVVGEHERALDREPLGLVAGERVGVGDVAGVEVAGGKGDAPAVVEIDDDRSLLAVDADDRAAAAVGDAEAAVVAGAEDAVADRELETVVEPQPLGRASLFLSSRVRATVFSSATSARR